MAAIPVAYMAYAAMAISAVSAVSSAQTAKKEAAYNSQIAEQNAEMARASGRAQSEQIRRQSVDQLGEMRASFSANGVGMEGSALDLMSESAYQFELDKQNAKYNAETKAIGYQNQGRLSQMRGQSQAQGAILGGLGKVAGAYGSSMSTGTGAGGGGYSPVYTYGTSEGE